MVSLFETTSIPRMIAIRSPHQPEATELPTRAGNVVTTKHVLIIDDELSIRIAARSVLEAAGFIVSEAADGTEALLALGHDIYRSQVPAIAILDLAMPHLNGEELMHVISKIDANYRPQVIVLTANWSPESAMRMAKLGARAYLSKPVAPNVLCDLVEYVIGTRFQPPRFVNFLSDCLTHSDILQ